jgi:hypothetical protein
MSMLLNLRWLVRPRAVMWGAAVVSLAISGCAGPLASSERGLSSQQSKATMKKAADDPFPTAAAAGIKKESDDKDGKKS